jgi:IS1 family transposase
MNQLPIETRARVLSCLVEGVSLRATARLCGVAINTVVKLQIEAGQACAAFQDGAFRNLSCQRVQCDEIWSFVGCKEQHLKPGEKEQGRGDCWTWTAIDPDSKLMLCWHVGLREAVDGIMFMEDLASRLKGRIQLSTDGHHGYLNAVENAFGANVDYGQAVKVYGPAEMNRIDARYSPGRCKEVRKSAIKGSPDFDNISTSHVERQNLNIRMGMRRFTRLTNAFSKKIENHGHALALYFMFYNFCRIHTTLRVTPAMEAGVADRVWEMSDVVKMMDSQAQQKAA